MAAKADNIISFKDLECPICLEQFKVPTSLPCLHTFCLKCLTSHIIDYVTQAGNADKFSCPVCREEIQTPQTGIPSSEWAKSFPIDNFKALMLPDSKEQLNCDSCAYEGTTSPVRGFCVVCKEHLCDECIKFHHKTKALREHKIITAEELTENSDLASVPRSLEAKLQETTEEKETSLKKLKHQVDHLTDEIQDLRQKVNALFDQIQEEVKEEGNGIYKEMSIKLLDEKQQCQSLLAALKNSHRLVQTVATFGSQSRVVSTLLKVEEQLEYYIRTVCHYQKEHKQADMKLDLDYRLKELGDLKWKHLVEVKYSDKKYINLDRNVCEKKIELADSYLFCCCKHASSATYSSSNRVILVDWNSKTCIMHDTAFNTICECPMSSSPSAVCKVGDEEFAVALPLERKIQFFTNNSSMKPTKFLRTRIACCGLAPLENGDIAVTYLSLRSLYVAVLSKSGYEKKCIQLDKCTRINYMVSITVDPTQTRAYVTCRDTNTLYVQELESSKSFKYQNPKLNDPEGIALDTHGNVFVVGSQSHNIHQLSPEGNLIRIITENISPFPHDTCFNEGGDQFIVTFKYPEYLIFHYK